MQQLGGDAVDLHGDLFSNSFANSSLALLGVWMEAHPSQWGAPEQPHLRSVESAQGTAPVCNWLWFALDAHSNLFCSVFWISTSPGSKGAGLTPEDPIHDHSTSKKNPWEEMLGSMVQHCSSCYLEPNWL